MVTAPRPAPPRRDRKWAGPAARPPPQHAPRARSRPPPAPSGAGAQAGPGRDGRLLLLLLRRRGQRQLGDGIRLQRLGPGAAAESPLHLPQGSRRGAGRWLGKIPLRVRLQLPGRIYAEASEARSTSCTDGKTRRAGGGAGGGRVEVQAHRAAAGLHSLLGLSAARGGRQQALARLQHAPLFLGVLAAHGETPRTCPALPLAEEAGRGAWPAAPRLYKGRRRRLFLQSGAAGGRRRRGCARQRWRRRCQSPRHGRAVGAAGGRRQGPHGELRLRVAGQRLRLGGRARLGRPGLAAGPGPAAARPRGRGAVRRAAGAGAGHPGQGGAGRPALLAPADAGPARGAGEDGAAAPGLQRALRAARGPPRPLRGARQGLPRRGAHRRGPRRGAHLPAHPGAAAGLAPLAQDPGTLRLGARLHPGLQPGPEAEHGLQGHQEEAVQLRAAAHRGVLKGTRLTQVLRRSCHSPSWPQ